jgi:hypothetical protein
MTLNYSPPIPPSSPCPWWQNKQYYPFFVIISPMTTISRLQTLPCMNVNRRLQSILDIYGMPPTNQGTSFDWSCLSSMLICQPDLSPLIRSLGFYHEGCLLTRKSTNSNRPYFLCNTCRLFKVSFVSSDFSSEHTSNQFYFDVSQSTYVHGPDCLGGTVVLHTNYSDILPHSRDLVSHLNVSFYHSDEFALISHQNIKQMMSPRYNLSQISQSAFSWMLIRMTRQIGIHS